MKNSVTFHSGPRRLPDLTNVPTWRRILCAVLAGASAVLSLATFVALRFRDDAPGTLKGWSIELIVDSVILAGFYGMVYFILWIVRNSLAAEQALLKAVRRFVCWTLAMLVMTIMVLRF